MKLFKVLRVVVLILVLCFTGFSQEQNKEVEIANDMLIKFGEYIDKQDLPNASDCLNKAVKLDPSKSFYLEILKDINNGKFAEALKRLEQKKTQSPSKKELIVIQIFSSEAHSRWGEAFRKNFDHNNAIAHYEIAYNIDKIYRRKKAALDMNNIGFLYYELNQKYKALEYLEKALLILIEVGDHSDEANTLNSLGRVYYELDQKQKALKYYEKALPIFCEVGNRPGEADTMNSLGLIYSFFGQKQKALEYYEKALPISHEVGDRSSEITILNNIGEVYYFFGQKQKSLEYYEKALSISHEVGDRSSEATILNNIGELYYSLSQKQEALKYYEKALSISHEVGDRSGEATILNNIGKLYYSLGQKQKALGYYEMALSISHEVEDCSGEATVVNNIGLLYSELGQNQKALEYFKKALRMYREVGNRPMEATALNNIGLVNYNLGQNQKALEYYEKALLIHREMDDRSGEVTALNNIGLVYFELSQKQKALEYFLKALPISRDIGDRSSEATSLNNIGLIYSIFGQSQKALAYFENALQIYLKVEDRAGEGTTLNNIGNLYSILGQKQKAIYYFDKALPFLHEAGNRNDEAVNLISIGKFYSDLDQNQKALEYYEKGLSILREIGDTFRVVLTLNNIGAIYYDLGQNKKSLEYYKKTLPICRDKGDRFGEAIIINNMGMLYLELGQNQKALEYLEKALCIFKEMADIADETILHGNLMVVYNKMNKNLLSIFYGKLAVNKLQYLRQNIDTLTTEAKIKYLQSIEDTYRDIAFLMINSGRISEAQQVLDILKVDEYDSYIRRDRSAYTPQYNPLDYTDFERKWIDQQNIFVEKMSSTSKPYHELLIKPYKTPEDQKRLEELKVEMEKSQKEYSDFLALMKLEFEKHEKEKAPDIDSLAKKSSTLKELLKTLDQENNGKNVALHFLVFKGQISVIITTPTDQILKQSPPFDEKEFNSMIYTYRDMIEKLKNLPRGVKLIPSSDNQIQKLSNQKRGIENKLYTFIFQPAAGFLKEYGASNLLVSLDGVLRYIPLSSLYDGEHYLAQKYRLVLLTPSSLKHIDKKFINEMKILGMGAGKGGDGFAPLPFVNREIRAIVNDTKKGFLGVINGNALIDDEFTRKGMVRGLKTTGYPFVHIASHFKFSPGDETKTKLLLGDGTIMSLSDIRKEGKLFNKVNLLVLSACETGVGGNGDEIDGFGELAQQSGAQSVIASLWPVADESTKELMVKFYSLLKEGKVTSKIEALRQAQLQLAGLEDLLNKNNHQTNQAVSQNKKYSNPYYWGPFIMMGNWR